MFNGNVIHELVSSGDKVGGMVEVGSKLEGVELIRARLASR